jgi:hypothetical protein
MFVTILAVVVCLWALGDRPAKETKKELNTVAPGKRESETAEKQTRSTEKGRDCIITGAEYKTNSMRYRVSNHLGRKRAVRIDEEQANLQGTASKGL